MTKIRKKTSTTRRRRPKRDSTTDCVQEKASHTSATMRNRPYFIMTVILIMLCVLCAIPRVLTLGSDCYTISGEDYRGTQNRIEVPMQDGDNKVLNPTNCLPWNNSREFDKPGARERGIGPHNYCRNPDDDVMPWCKVKEDGTWGYCHLPTCQAPGYLGCFVDKGHPPALDEIFVKHEGRDFTVASCLEFCRSQNYKYAGVESGMACYCGNGGYERYGKASHRGNHCNTKCFGDDSQPCGGDGYMDIYKAHLGQCQGATLTSSRDVIYNHGYPYKPGSVAMVASVKAAKRMVAKLQNAGDKKLRTNSNSFKSLADVSCEWVVDVKNAKDIRLMMRKIDKKLDLGGSLHIKALDDATITVMLSSIQIPTNNRGAASNATSSVSNHVSISTREITVTDSTKVPGEFKIKAARDNEQPIDAPVTEESTSDGKSIVESKENSWTLPSTSEEPLLTVTGGKFSVKFVRDDTMKETLNDLHSSDSRRARARRRQMDKEWSRFAIEYEANFPPGVDPADEDDSMLVNEDNLENNLAEERTGPPSRRKGTKNRGRGKNQKDKSQIVIYSQLNQEDTQSLLNKILPDHIFPGGTEDASNNVDKKKNMSTSIQIDVDVTVDFDPTEKKKNKQPIKNSAISELTMPLLLAVLFITTAILVFTAGFLIFRRGGPNPFKKGGKSMVVSLDDKKPEDQYPEKPDKIDDTDFYFTSQETGDYSPSKRNSASIKTLIDLLKHHPGMFPRSRSDIEYKQTSQIQKTPTDANELPLPCPYCCGCQQSQEEFCHHAKIGQKMSNNSRHGKNIRGLTVKAQKSKTLNIVPAPPLSPITEVSSVASSTLSLAPMTSPNSLTSLIPRTQSLQTKPSGKSVTWKLRTSTNSLLDDSAAASADETEAFLSQRPNDSDGVQLKRSSRASDKDTKLPFRKKQLVGGSSFCYDSGYATSNYEEEEEDRNIKHKDNKISFKENSHNLVT